MANLRSFLRALTVLIVTTGAVRASGQEILLPIVTGPTPGAYGSVWSTAVTMFNSGPTPIVLYPPCATDPCLPGPQIESGASFTLPQRDAISGGTFPGLIFDIAPADFPNFHAHLRVFDQSRDSLDRGTELPVVILSQLGAGRPTELLDVPTDSRFRLTLRVYARTAFPDAELRIFAEPSEKLLYTQNLSLGLSQGSSYTLGYVQLDPKALLTGALPDRLRIEVKPGRGDARLFAFVSVTNIETQHFTTITPQPTVRE